MTTQAHKQTKSCWVHRASQQRKKKKRKGHQTHICTHSSHTEWVQFPLKHLVQEGKVLGQASLQHEDMLLVVFILAQSVAHASLNTLHCEIRVHGTHRLVQLPRLDYRDTKRQRTTIRHHKILKIPTSTRRSENYHSCRKETRKKHALHPLVRIWRILLRNLSSTGPTCL